MSNFDNIKNIVLKIAKLIKDFLFKPKSKEFFLYVFFCGLATIFWFMLTLNENHKENFVVPVELVGLPSNVMLTNTPDSVLVFNITARGSKILDYKLRNTFGKKASIELKFDSLLLISKKNHIKLSTTSLSRYLYSKYKDVADITISSPDTLEYIYAEGEAKRVPLLFNGKLETSSQYFILDTYLSPDSIDVYAPSKILEGIKEVQTESFSLSDIMESQSKGLKLLPIRGAKFFPDSTRLNIIVDAITEKTVIVPLIGVNFPDNKSLLTFPSEVQVTFQIGTKLFNTIDANDFSIELPYEELVKQEGNYPIKLTKYPVEAKRIRISHKNVDFLIERKLKRLDK